MAVHQKPDGRWYCKYRDETGRQRTKTFGRGREAKKQAEALDLELKAGKKRGQAPPRRSEVYLDDLARAYLADREMVNSPDHIKTLENLLDNHWLPLLTDKPVDELTYTDVISRLGQHHQYKTMATRNRHAGYLSAIFRFGILHGLTKNNPLAGYRKQKEPRRRVALTIDDLKKIIANAAPHLAWTIEVEWNLGARPGPTELFNIKWADVDFDRGCVWIWARKTQDWRDVPISDGFRKRLLQMKTQAQTEFLVEYQGRPIKKLRRSFQTACKRAEIPYPCRMYDVRHLFASVLLAGGADLAAVSKLLGHASTQMTADVYYELLKGEKERAVALLPDLGPNEKRTEKVIPLRSAGDQNGIH